MAARAPAGFTRYLYHLAAAVVFPLLWLRSHRFARSQRDIDPRAPLKVAIAIGASVILAGVAGLALFNYHESATAGMYRELDARLAEAVGEGAYQGHIDNLDAHINSLSVAVKKLNETVANNPGNVSAAEVAAAKAQHDQSKAVLARLQGDGGLIEEARTTRDVDGAVARMMGALTELQVLEAQLEPLAFKAMPSDDPANATSRVFGDTFRTTAGYFRENLTSLGGVQEHHRLYLDLSVLVEAQDDAAVKDLLAATPVQRDGMAEGATRAFAVKDDAFADMNQIFVWFLIPCVVGLFFAPLVYAVGNILHKSYEPSETVGFKPYPSTSMAWFLALGGFGVPALFFAAWAFKDMDDRAREGQIAL
jgi:hypothetical protein